MGYMLKAGDDYGHDALNITHGVWMDVIQTASEQGYSDPDLRLEQGVDEHLIFWDTAAALADALNRALVAQTIELEVGDGSTLDRDLTRRIVHILQLANREGRAAVLSRKPSGKDGDD